MAFRDIRLIGDPVLRTPCAPITAVDDVGVASMVAAQRWRYDGVLRLGPDIRMSLVPASS